jgi:hypothetical protein
MNQQQEELLSKIYNDETNPAGFASAQSLWTEAKKEDPSITEEHVKHFLQGHRTYTLMRPRRVHYPRSKTIAAGLFTDCQIDLADLKSLSRTNKGFKYLLLAIDVLSKRIFVVPMRTKTAKDTVEAFESLINQMPQAPSRIYTDLGSEFRNELLRGFFKDHDIQKEEAATATIKASLAERAIRNLKQRLYRYFAHNKTTNWIDVVQTIADSINRSKSRTHGMRPIDVNFKNAQRVWKILYGNALSSKRMQKPKFKKGDMVRASIRGKPIFDKGYIPSWGDAIYEVKEVQDHKLPIKYKLTNRGQPLSGLRYAQELARVRKEADIEKKVQKVLKKKTNPDGTKQLLVRYFGIEEPEWIHEDELQ